MTKRKGRKKKKRSGNIFVFDTAGKVVGGIGDAINSTEEFDSDEWKRRRSIQRAKRGDLKTARDKEIYKLLAASGYWKRMGKHRPI